MFTVMQNLDHDYSAALNRIIETIEGAQVKTVVVANRQMLWAYWNIGNELSARTLQNGWGARVIDTLSKDLRKKFPTVKGFSSRNLLYMRQFAEAYPADKIMHLNDLWQQMRQNTQQMVALIKNTVDLQPPIAQPVVAQLGESDFVNSLVGQISWSHHLILLEKCPKMAPRFWYMLNTLEHGNSKNILLMQIEAGLFERQVAGKKLPTSALHFPRPNQILPITY